MHVVNRLIIQDRILQVVDLSKTTRMLFALAKEAAPIAAQAAHEATPSPQQEFAIALTKTVEQLRRMMLRAEQSSTAAADVISPSPKIAVDCTRRSSASRWHGCWPHG